MNSRLILRVRNMPRRQRGAVLIVSLIILVILTLLAISGMSNTSIEERMASFSQETQRAFQAAESGVAIAFGNVDSFNLTTAQVQNNVQIGASPDRYTTSTSYIGSSLPPRSATPYETGYQAHHFVIQSTGLAHGGLANGGAQLNVSGGAYQISN